MGTAEEKRFLKNLGQRINQIRKEKDISFQELAFRCEIEKSNLIKLTTKGTNITMTSLFKIANGLGVSIEYIFQSTKR
jgi:transcriptional regulator with XRE-family HTH domain